MTWLDLLIVRSKVKTNYEKLKAWKERSAKRAQEKRKSINRHGMQKSSTRSKLASQSKNRRSENIAYGRLRKAFLKAHPICILTGQPATQIHHIAKRYGKWLNLQRYWCGVSPEGHDIIEKHKAWASDRGLILRINQTYDEHVALIKELWPQTWPEQLAIPIIYIDKENIRAIMEDVKVKKYLNYKQSE